MCFYQDNACLEQFRIFWDLSLPLLFSLLVSWLCLKIFLDSWSTVCCTILYFLDIFLLETSVLPLVPSCLKFGACQTAVDLSFLSSHGFGPTVSRIPLFLSCFTFHWSNSCRFLRKGVYKVNSFVPWMSKKYLFCLTILAGYRPSILVTVFPWILKTLP